MGGWQGSHWSFISMMREFFGAVYSISGVLVVVGLAEG